MSKKKKVKKQKTKIVTKKEKKIMPKPSSSTSQSSSSNSHPHHHIPSFVEIGGVRINLTPEQIAALAPKSTLADSELPKRKAAQQSPEIEPTRAPVKRRAVEAPVESKSKSQVPVEKPVEKAPSAASTQNTKYVSPKSKLEALFTPNSSTEEQTTPPLLTKKARKPGQVTVSIPTRTKDINTAKVTMPGSYHSLKYALSYMAKKAEKGKEVDHNRLLKVFSGHAENLGDEARASIDEYLRILESKVEFTPELKKAYKTFKSKFM